jgi:hexosaminidase
MVLPRMLALSEVVWSPRGAREWGSFFRRLPAHLSRLDGMGANYRIPDVFGLDGDHLTLDDSVLVELSAPVGNGAVRYTLDGTDPGPTSSPYERPFSLGAGGSGTEVAARVVLPDGRIGPVRRALFRKARLAPPTPLPRSRRARGLAGLVVPGEFPSVDSLPAPEGWGTLLGKEVKVHRVTLPEEVPGQSFGLLLHGFVRVPRAGIYTFYLSSDDGSRLKVAGEIVVDHDGYHSVSEKRGQAALHRGWHPLEIRFFQGGGGASLRLEIEGPGMARREVPAHWLTHLPG